MDNVPMIDGSRPGFPASELLDYRSVTFTIVTGFVHQPYCGFITMFISGNLANESAVSVNYKSNGEFM